MTLWPFKKRNPASELAKLGHEQRRNHIAQVTQQIRKELGMKPHPALERRVG